MTVSETKLKETYDEKFYAGQSSGSYRAAQLVIPHIFKAIGSPSSVLDIGCGVSTWLRAIKDHLPNTEILGVDHPDVPINQLMIPKDKFLGRDLRQSLNLGRKFELALSLELGEHLDKPYAMTLIANLVRHADKIVFSAAIPGQGGRNHINECWPSYWIDLFSSQGYRCYDIIRPKIWADSEIPFWYRQNIMLFTKMPLQLEKDTPSFEGSNLVHPELFGSVLNRSVTGREALAVLKAAVRRYLWN